MLLVAVTAALILPTVWAADVERTRARLADVVDAAATIREETPACPSGDDLVAARIYARPPTDSWGGRVEIRCVGERVVAISAGPDGRAGTEDDIRR